MGLDVRVLKPTILSNSEDDDTVYIYTLNFEPIRHLTKFTEGYYKCEEIFSPSFHIPYGTYGDFRRKICQMVFDVDISEVWNDIEKYIDSPFIEFLNFADNEGSFDYVIAEKLYNDFLSYKQKAKDYLSDRMFLCYKDYMEILKIASDNKAVVYYY